MNTNTTITAQKNVFANKLNYRLTNKYPSMCIYILSIYLSSISILSDISEGGLCHRYWDVDPDFSEAEP